MSSSIRVDTRTIAELAMPVSPNRAATEALFTVGCHRNLLTLRRLHDRLVVEAVPWVAKSGFDAAFDALRRQPSPVQRRVLGHPAAGFWIDVAHRLVARRAHERFPELHFTEHLRAFARFAAAAVLLSGRGTLTCTVRADVAGRVSLPGAGVAVEFAGIEPCDRVELTVRDGAVAVPAGRARVRTVPLLSNGVELNGLDHDLRLGGRTGYAFEELSDDDARRWVEVLDGCWQRIAAVSPELGTELTLGIRALVPVRSPDPGIHLSGSFHEAPGLVALSTGNHWQITEALVHEYGHQKLNAILNLDPLVVGPTAEAVFYSPWRDDPRPLTGLLHAVFTFTTILGFYRLMADELDPAGPGLGRAYRIGRQLGIGMAELRGNASLSPLGRALVDALDVQGERYRAAVPAPTRQVRDREDDILRAHRERSHPHRAPSPPPKVRATEPDQAGAAVLRALGLPEDWWPDALLTDRYPRDVLLDRVRELPDTAALTEALARPGPASLPVDLAAGHLAYVTGDYQEATARYAACVRHAPASPYLWQCLAFALRHQRRYDDALYVLTHLDECIRRAEVPADLPASVTRERLSSSWGLRPSAAGGPPRIALPDAATSAAVAETLASRYRYFVAATRGGTQLPALIAVTAGLKPAMDTWIPYDGWPAFTALIDELGLEFFVDAYFDRHSEELGTVPPEQLTTTRAGFSAVQREGTEAHVFLARDADRLHEAVGAGWYPLVVDGHVVNKHRADHDRFGDALGYPTCCQEFFRRRNNWHDDNTYFAALRDTAGPPSILCNPFLRHTRFGLISHMPCSYDCAETVRYAMALSESIAEELPVYGRAMTSALSQPILCVSELRMYRFDGLMGDRYDVSYTAVESLNPIEASDPLLHLLRQGNRCEIDGGVIRIRDYSGHVSCYLARGDRHGPEYPFLIAFSESVTDGVVCGGTPIGP